MSQTHPEASAGGARLPAPAAFLGALVSEVNEPEILAPAFAAVADISERVVTAVRAGTLSEEDAAGQLQKLRLTDGADAQWAVGATSLRWYRKAAGASGWKLASPPQEADSSCEASCARALAALPPGLLEVLGPAPQIAPAPSYARDPFAPTAATPPAPWEYEAGDARHAAASSAWPQPSDS